MRLNLPSGRARAFTLIEVLVATAVLALLLVLTLQLIDGVVKTVTSGGKHIDSDEESRLLFNRLSIDLSSMIKRTDMDYSTFKQPTGALGTQYNGATVPATTQAGNDLMAFYAETDGYFSGTSQPIGAQKAPISLVAYLVAADPYSNCPAMRRLGKGLGWDPNSSAWGSIALLPLTLMGEWSDLFSTQNGQTVDTDYQTVGSQVVRFEYTYLLKANLSDPTGVAYPGKLSVTPYWSNTNNMASSAATAHTCINGFKDVAAIVVAIVVLDTTSRAVLPNSNSYTPLAAVFPDAAENIDIAPTWNAAINSSGFAATAGIPTSAAAGLRVYERYLYLSTSP